MPAPSRPTPESREPSVLDGTPAGQIAAIWTYLSDGDRAIYPIGLVTGGFTKSQLRDAGCRCVCSSLGDLRMRLAEVGV